MTEPVAAVVAEAGVVVADPAQEPVQGHGLRGTQRGTVVGAEPGAVVAGQLGQDRLLQPGRGLAGGSSHRDRERLATSSGLVVEDGQEPGHRGGLAGSGAPGDHRRPLLHGRARGRPLLGVVGVLRCLRRGKDPGQHLLDAAFVDGRGRVSGAGEQVGAHGDLQPVVAVEVDQAVLVPQHPLGQQGRALHRRHPVVVRGPGQVRVDLAHPGQVGAHRAVGDRPDREGGGEQDPIVDVSRQRRGPPRDVHRRRGQDAGPVEVRQQAGGAQRQPGVALVERFPELGHGTAPSIRSLSATTRADGGRQEKTPVGCPS